MNIFKISLVGLGVVASSAVAAAATGAAIRIQRSSRRARGTRTRPRTPLATSASRKNARPARRSAPARTSMAARARATGRVGSTRRTSARSPRIASRARIARHARWKGVAASQHARACAPRPSAGREGAAPDPWAAGTAPESAEGTERVRSEMEPVHAELEPARSEAERAASEPEPAPPGARGEAAARSSTRAATGSPSRM
jgi:hypothetical protein